MCGGSYTDGASWEDPDNSLCNELSATSRSLCEAATVSWLFL